MDFSIIKDLLDERNMTFQDLCDILKVDRSNLYNSLTKGNPTLQRLESIANVLCVPVWRLFTIDNKPDIYGTIVYEGKMYSISTKEELLKIATLIINK